MIEGHLAAAPDPSLMMFVGFAILLLGGIIVNAFRKRAFFRTCERVAEKLGGRFEKESLFQLPEIQFRVEGRVAAIDFFAGRDPSTTVTIALGRAAPGSLKIIEETFGQSILKLFGAQDISIGDAGFDSHYVIKSTPDTLAGQVFEAKRRADVMAAVRRLKGLSRPVISLSEGELTVVCKKRLDDETSLLMLAQSAIDFAGFLLHLDPDAGIEWVATAENPGVACPVCSAPLREPVVRCEDCGMPHHEECWTWLGKCAIYACEGKRPRRRAA